MKITPVSEERDHEAALAEVLQPPVRGGEAVRPAGRLAVDQCWVGEIRAHERL